VPRARAAFAVERFVCIRRDCKSGLCSLLHPSLMQWLSFGFGLLPTRRTTGGAEAAHGQGLWQRQGSWRGACKSVTLAGFTSHPRQAEGEAILILSSVMRSLWIASAACSESNESCLSLKVVAHFIDLHSQPHFNDWPIEVVSPEGAPVPQPQVGAPLQGCQRTHGLCARRLAEVLSRPWVGDLNLKRCHKPPNR
jgi:hypothetical protein